MKPSDASIMFWAVAPSAGFAAALLGWISLRLAFAQPPLPDGAAPTVTVLAVIVPMACVAIANFRRLRRDA